MDEPSCQPAVLQALEHPEESQRAAEPAASKPWGVRLGKIVGNLSEVLFDPIDTDHLPRRVDSIAGDLISFVAIDTDRALFEIHRYGRDQHAL